MNSTVVNEVHSWLEIENNKTQLKLLLDESNVDQNNELEVIHFFNTNYIMACQILSSNAENYNEKLSYHWAFDRLLKQFHKSIQQYDFDLDDLDEEEITDTFDEEYLKLTKNNLNIKKLKKILGTIELIKIMEHKYTQKHGIDANKKLVKYFRRKLREEYCDDYGEEDGWDVGDLVVGAATVADAFLNPVSFGLKVLRNVK